MPCRHEAAPTRAARLLARGTHLLAGLTLVAGVAAGAQAQGRPEAAVLLDGLCAKTLRPNEEDRLLGLISISVRAAIKYAGGVFSPDMIDDSVQDALRTITDACPRLAATDDPHRLGLAVQLATEATTNRMRDGKRYSEQQTEIATAADLSQELSATEIDAWLDALPARQRALALFLYASDVTRDEMAQAVGLSPPALESAFRGAKADLLKFFRAEATGTALPPPMPSPAMQYREAGPTLAGSLQPAAAAAAPTTRITGISSDLYAGWSLLATITGLPPERTLEIGAPMLVEADGPRRRRMAVVAAEEISDPHDTPRRFLLKAFALDGDKSGAGLHDSFHFAAAAIDNPAALQTLQARGLASIEIARCLWRDYGTGEDPGLCR